MSTGLIGVVHELEVNGTDLLAGANAGAPFPFGLGIFRSTNNGTSWTAINSGLPTDPYASSIVTSGTSIFAGIYPGVFRSTNEGTNWTSVNSGLPTNTSVWCLAVNEMNFFAGTYSNGVFLSMDNGESWSEVNTGFPANTTVSAFAILVQACSRVLLLAVFGGAPYRR